MKLNTIDEITNFIFIGKDFEELTKYDLLIINSDWAEKELAKDLKKMFDQRIIDNNTVFIITKSHSGSFSSPKEDTSNILIKYLNDYGFKNKIIINDKYISNPEIIKNINKIVNINEYKSILRIAKSFVARRWYMNAKKYNFPIDKCDFYGINDDRNISKEKWFLTEEARKQIMKELINIGQLYLDGELTID